MHEAVTYKLQGRRCTLDKDTLYLLRHLNMEKQINVHLISGVYGFLGCMTGKKGEIEIKKEREREKVIDKADDDVM